MNANELYDYITSQITPEVALRRFLESSLITYQKLRFPVEGEEVHPLILLSTAAMEMGWDFLVEKTGESDEVRGICTGTSAYLDTIKFK